MEYDLYRNFRIEMRIKLKSMNFELKYQTARPIPPPPLVVYYTWPVENGSRIFAGCQQPTSRRMTAG